MPSARSAARPRARSRPSPAVKPLRLRYRARPSALATARASLSEWLELVGVSEQEAYEIVVACNEACTNSIEHPLHRPGADFFELDADCAAKELELVVRDFGRWRDRVLWATAAEGSRSSPS